MTPEKSNLQALLKNGTVEIRCIDKTSDLAKQLNRPIIWSGVYDNYDALRDAAKMGLARGWDVYNTINPSRIPATNKILEPFQRTTRDSDIIRINTIFFDFDPVRTTGTAATEKQVDDSIAQAQALYVFLYEYGWGIPLIGLSGNGCHLMYRTDIDPLHAKSFHGLYAGLDMRFSNENISFDVTVKNPARIARTYGTVNQKCAVTTSCNDTDDSVSEAVVLESIKKLTPPERKSTWVQPAQSENAGEYIKNFDIVGAFKSSGLYVRHDEGDKHIVKCPWESSHTTKGSDEVAIWQSEWAQFNCLHSHCANKTILDVIEIMGANK